MSRKNSFPNVIILFCLYIQIFSSSSIAIDFGSEFITTSILLPRKPIKLVENPQGTKINQYLYMKDDEKIFGQNAKVKAIKSPEAVFHHLQEFLGKTEDSPEVKNYLKKYFQIYDITTDPKTKNIKFKLNYGKKDYLFNSQELLAIMFKYIKDFSDKFGNTKIDQFLLTIPCFYTYKQHQALLNAAEMSGMKLVHLIHDNAAVAIKYFNENRIQKEEKLYIFYNMGASYTQVSLVSVHATYQGTKKKYDRKSIYKNS
jgi:molecular chaperone DnaK (HSP70)